MLTQKNNQNNWLTDLEHPAINLARWQQQTDLISELYQAERVLIIESYSNEYMVVCNSFTAAEKLSSGSLFPGEALYAELSKAPSYELITLDSAALGNELSQFKNILSQPLYWPDGRLFGCILICAPNINSVTPINSSICDSIKAFIQGELKQLYLMEQLQRLSVQDEFTCMLNPYGFNLMAPRQLSLSRRFGSHAGLIVLEEMPTHSLRPPKHSESQRIRVIASVISESMREADISARIKDEQFIILAFVDNASNLDTLIARLFKRLNKEAPEIKLITGKCFFTPDTQQSLAPMQEQAIADLERNRLKATAKYAGLTPN